VLKCIVDLEVSVRYFFFNFTLGARGIIDSIRDKVKLKLFNMH